ncbi:hypothetical protein Rcas_2238 [Roseiflexus castenholzii DSM 13941]|uniref:Uncharacterized protein n=1 Tax=Roseiflexus castenholzii (strain DSM 13941 / HLO8) TaxID=383372 RepID=A7NLD8_ROSCS|nr:hypothetical protein Rcas_2238 [Roseiflexus castenholzii DSM 13941]
MRRAKLSTKGQGAAIPRKQRVTPLPQTTRTAGAGSVSMFMGKRRAMLRTACARHSAYNLHTRTRRAAIPHKRNAPRHPELNPHSLVTSSHRARMAQMINANEPAPFQIDAVSMRSAAS